MAGIRSDITRSDRDLLGRGSGRSDQEFKARVGAKCCRSVFRSTIDQPANIRPLPGELTTAPAKDLGLVARSEHSR